MVRQNVRILMNTYCAPLVADMLFFICSERELMLSLSDNNQSNIIEDSKRV